MTDPQPYSPSDQPYLQPGMPVNPDNNTNSAQNMAAEPMLTEPTAPGPGTSEPFAPNTQQTYAQYAPYTTQGQYAQTPQYPSSQYPSPQYPYPPQQPYQAPAQNYWGATQPKKQTSPLAIASLVLGIISIIFSFIPFINIFSFFTALVAIGVGIPAIILTNKNNQHKGRGLAITGIVLGVVSFIVTIIINVAVIQAINSDTEFLSQLSSVEDSIRKESSISLRNHDDLISSYTKQTRF